MLITRISTLTGKERTRDLNVSTEQMKRWRKGVLIQNVMSHLSPEDREFIINGTTQEEWDEFMPREEE